MIPDEKCADMEVGRDHFQTVLIIMEVEKEQFSNIEGQSFGAR